MMLKLVAEGLVALKASAEPDVKKNALDGLTTIIHSNWGVLREMMGDIELFAY